MISNLGREKAEKLQEQQQKGSNMTKCNMSDLEKGTIEPLWFLNGKDKFVFKLKRVCMRKLQ